MTTATSGSPKPNPLFKLGAYLRKGEATESGQQLFLKGGRQADVFYRNRLSLIHI